MSIQNKIVAVGLSVDVDFMYTGAIVRIIFKRMVVSIMNTSQPPIEEP